MARNLMARTLVSSFLSTYAPSRRPKHHRRASSGFQREISFYFCPSLCSIFIDLFILIWVAGKAKLIYYSSNVMHAWSSVKPLIKTRSTRLFWQLVEPTRPQHFSAGSDSGRAEKNSVIAG
jgi:hypothetical protein